MLHTHLIAKTRPTANSQNILFWHNYRITVLDDRLFRIENSKSHHFVDQATNAVWFRDMPPVDYTTMEKDNSFHIIFIIARIREKSTAGGFIIHNS
jgi:hypothetical protein